MSSHGAKSGKLHKSGGSSFLNTVSSSDADAEETHKSRTRSNKHYIIIPKRSKSIEPEQEDDELSAAVVPPLLKRGPPSDDGHDERETKVKIPRSRRYNITRRAASSCRGEGTTLPHAAEELMEQTTELEEKNYKEVTTKLKRITSKGHYDIPRKSLRRGGRTLRAAESTEQPEQEDNELPATIASSSPLKKHEAAEENINDVPTMVPNDEGEEKQLVGSNSEPVVVQGSQVRMMACFFFVSGLITTVSHKWPPR